MKRVLSCAMVLVMVLLSAGCGELASQRTLGSRLLSGEPLTEEQSAQAPEVVVEEQILFGSLIDDPPRLTAQPDAVNDPISVKALTGSWSRISSGVAVLYTFGEDGTFGEYTVITFYTTYMDSYGWYYSRATSSSKFFTMGRYRVKGGVIEFYDCMKASASAYDTEWFHDSSRNDAASKLMTMPLEFFTPADDFALEFEFIDAERLRLRSDSSDYDYDWDGGEPHETELPTHQIPPAPWPERALSPEAPVFTETGRIRSVTASYYDEDEPDEYKRYTVIIDHTDREACDAYIKALKKAGWTVTEDLTDWPTARKGLYRMDIRIRDDRFEITAVKERKGIWPVEWFQESVYPPDDSIIVGAIDTSDWEENENIYLSVTCYAVDEPALEAYRDTLLADGFEEPEDDYGWYDMEVYKYIRINGRMYKVRIAATDTTGDFTELEYDLYYYEDGVWPVEWLSETVYPPEGCVILGRIDTSEWEKQEDIYLYTDCYDMDDEALEAYGDKLLADGFMEPEDDYGWYALDVYKYIRINGSMYKVRVSADSPSEHVANIRYYLNYYEDGEWPVEWLSESVYPPEGCVILGRIDTSDWEKQDDIYLTINVCGVDEGALEGYYDQLLEDGFTDVEDGWGWYDTEVYKFLRIDGDMYKVRIGTMNPVDGVAELTYNLYYYEDSSWPQDIPPGIRPPEGCDILGNLEVDGDDYSYFTFYCQPMDDTAAGQYMDALLAEGWDIDTSWSSMEAVKDITWKGKVFSCSIDYWGATEGLGEFSVWFSPMD